jgi:DNA polymerase III subunit epsilon
MKLSRPLVFLDLETTGPDPAKDRIVEVALAQILPSLNSADAYEVVHFGRQFHSRVNPDVPIPAEATAVHGIVDADVVNAPTFAVLAPHILEVIGDGDLCGFAVNTFDVPLLCRQLRESGYPLDMVGRCVVDVKTLYHRLRPRGLVDAHRDFLGTPHARAHAAMSDVIAVADVLCAVLHQHPDLPQSPQELAALLGDPDRSTWLDPDGKFTRNEEGRAVFSFGKYRGESLAHIAKREPGFLRWMLTKDFTPEVKRLVEEALAWAGAL